MTMLVLDAQLRDGKTSPKVLRKNRVIPAIYYGKGEEGISLQVEYKAFRNAFRAAGSTQVIDLNFDGKKKPVLVHDLQYHPLTDEISHVDFLHVNLKEKVTAHVPVEVIGVSPAVKNHGANLTIVKHELEVKCLPMEIPHTIEIDVSVLENIGDVIHVSDLKLGSKVEIHAGADEVLITVSAPKVVEEIDVAIPDDIKAEPTAAPAEGEKKSE